LKKKLSENLIYCKYCKKHIEKDIYEKHLKNPTHLKIKDAYESGKEDLIKE
jgi:hypothetical protein